MWEHWNGERSHIHNCYNGIGSWFYQALAGIRPDEQAPGYKHFFIEPQMIESLTWVEASQNTPYGTIKVRWEKNKQTLNLHITVPNGSTATLILPNEQIELTSGTHQVNRNL